MEQLWEKKDLKEKTETTKFSPETVSELEISLSVLSFTIRVAKTNCCVDKGNVICKTCIWLRFAKKTQQWQREQNTVISCYPRSSFASFQLCKKYRLKELNGEFQERSAYRCKLWLILRSGQDHMISGSHLPRTRILLLYHIYTMNMWYSLDIQGPPKV